MGIQTMYQIQRNKCFPLPTYNLDTPNRVIVTIYGKILDKNYTQLLHSNENLDLETVFLLDKVQKKEIISMDDYKRLKKNGLAEGRYPNIFVSFKVAELVGQKTEYVKNLGLNDDVCKTFIISTLKKIQRASNTELLEVIDAALPAILDEKQKRKKLSNLLQDMKKSGIVDSGGGRRYAKWFLVESKSTITNN